MAIGAEFIVPSIDKNYYNSLKEIKGILRRWYPEIGFNGRLKAEELIRNNVSGDNTGLLFSGGLDSTYLYKKMDDEQLELFSMLGGVIPTSNKEIFHRIKRFYYDFFEKEDVRINFMETDAMRWLDEHHINARYGRFFKGSDNTWWGKINHGLVQSSLCAPLTVNNISHLSLSSSGRDAPDGSNASLISRINWGGISVVPRTGGVSRHEKMKHIIRCYKDKDYHPIFQICNYAPRFSNRLNCGSCDKCTSTIISLLLLKEDPRAWGLPMIEGFYNHVRKIIPYSNAPQEWKAIKEDINDEERYGSQEDYSFFCWLKNCYQFLEEGKTNNIQKHKWVLLSLTDLLPQRLKMRVLELFYDYRYLKSLESEAKKSSYK